MRRATRATVSRPAATTVQTRTLMTHRREVVTQLRTELDLPATPSGRPALVMFMGLPGVGKSHSARIVAARLGGAHVASDDVRARLFIAPSYTEEENRAVFGIVEGLTDELLAQGHRVVLDATHLLARYRTGPERAARAHAAPVVHVLMLADDAEARARLAGRARSRATNDRSEADERVYERMRAAAFEPPAGEYLEVRNGPELERDLERVVRAVEVATFA